VSCVALARNCDNLPSIEVLSGSSNNHVATLVLPLRNKDDGKLYFADFGAVDLDGSTCYMSRMDRTQVVDVRPNLGQVTSWTCTFPADKVTGLPAGNYKTGSFESQICDIRVGPSRTTAYFGRTNRFTYTHGVTKSVTVRCGNLPMDCPADNPKVACADTTLWWTAAFRTITEGVMVDSSVGRLQPGEGAAAVDLALDAKCDAVNTVTKQNRDHSCNWLPTAMPMAAPVSTVPDCTSRYGTCTTAQRFVTNSVRYVVRPKSVTVGSGNIVSVDCQFDECEI